MHVPRNRIMRMQNGGESWRVLSLKVEGFLPLSRVLLAIVLAHYSRGYRSRGQIPLGSSLPVYVNHSCPQIVG